MGLGRREVGFVEKNMKRTSAELFIFINDMKICRSLTNKTLHRQKTDSQVFAVSRQFLKTIILNPMLSFVPGLFVLP